MKLRFLLAACALFALALNARAQDIAPGEVYSSQVAPTHNETPPAATPYEGVKKGLFERHDNRERVVAAPDKSVQLKKLKFGSDQSEGSGAFKRNLMDDAADTDVLTRVLTNSKSKNDSSSPEAEASASPAAKPKSSESPTPTPSASPSASPESTKPSPDRDRKDRR